MADDKQVDFVDGATAVTEQFLDRIQEVNQALAWNLNVTISGTSIVVGAGTLENTSSLVIKGKMRYNNTALTINFSALAVGTYGIWANTVASDATTGYTIQAVLGTGTPAGVTYTRKLATVEWTGAALQNIILLSPYLKHGQMHSSTGGDPLLADSITADQIVNGSIGTSEIAEGAITPSKLSIIPFARGSKTAYTIASGSYTALSFETTPPTQRGGIFWNSGTPDRLICPVAGVYIVTVNARIGPVANAGASFKQIELLKNGVVVEASNDNFGTYAYPSISYIDYLNAGEFVSSQALQDYGTDFAISWAMAMTWIGP